MKISVCIIVYKTKYLEHSFASLIDQTHKDVEFLILDQEDGVWSASDFLEEKFSAYRNNITSWDLIPSNEFGIILQFHHKFPLKLF